ncbi:S41 family peptidase [Solimicrobium silvestre]|uniref:Peptidase family S41 n=1 Tax=Solimicrobium silvestre TaxID=2099400 RepID=A0A2S9H4F9_9BURK|nr:S41 family peptidase [Solimicrobium silvestre]PRC94821.1 Peptidase family S41 [Solimicrobium silvestre]
MNSQHYLQRPNHFISRIACLLIASACYMVSASVSADTVANASLKTPPGSAEEWAVAAKIDLNAAYEETLNNHPGVYDPHNPDFINKLELAKKNGLAIASQVHDAAGYAAAISAFNTGLHDGHAGAFSTLDDKQMPVPRWPGFFSVWRGDGLYIYASEHADLHVGAKIVSCDGVQIKDVILNNVFAFEGRSDEVGHWWVRAGKVFVDRGNPFVTLPQQCQFSFDGQLFKRDIKWEATDSNFEQWRKRAYNGDELPVGLTEPRAKLFWVAMPTFDPNEAERIAYLKLSAEVLEKREHMLNADAIVIDLRHNQGGSSMWSKHFAEALWGEARVNRKMDAYSRDYQVWWRASQDNTDYMLGLVDQFKQQEILDSAAWASENGNAMKAALLRGDKYYIARDEAGKNIVTDPNVDLPTDPVPLSKPVYVIVPGQCASACLDALDVFTRFAGTKLIGAPSSADSTYMEVRVKTLPSGFADVLIPNKMYVNRPRVSGQGYLPEITVDDLEWSTANLLKVVEKDLALKYRDSTGG